MSSKYCAKKWFITNFIILDIRDTVNYKEVMKQYNLGPNGGIVTTLNLFSTKFGQVVDLVRKAGEKHKYCVIDTPGQIEVFTWSASGTIITEALATSFPTVVVYVMDVPRSKCPTTFMSNMLYACSILYKARLPFIVVMNKVCIRINVEFHFSKMFTNLRIVLRLMWKTICLPWNGCRTSKRSKRH